MKQIFHPILMDWIRSAHFLEGLVSPHLCYWMIGFPPKFPAPNTKKKIHTAPLATTSPRVRGKTGSSMSCFLRPPPCLLFQSRLNSKGFFKINLSHYRCKVPARVLLVDLTPLLLIPLIEFQQIQCVSFGAEVFKVLPQKNAIITNGTPCIAPLVRIYLDCDLNDHLLSLLDA
jgi:hypothetical protein